MSLEQFLQVACLFLVIGVCVGWLLATMRHGLFRAIDRLFPPRYLKTAILYRRPESHTGRDDKQ